mgnify:CR=1 FL=1
MDYYGRWKALHYMAKKFFSPLLVSGLEDPSNGSIEIHVTSGLMKTVKSKVRWVVTDLTVAKLIDGEALFNIPPRVSRRVKTLRIAGLIDRHAF